jgi:hypothetical protein
MLLGPVDVALGFPARAPAIGISGDVIVTRCLPVQVLGVAVRGDHIRSAGVPRGIRVSIGDGCMLPRQCAGGPGVTAAIDPAPAVGPDDACFQVEMLLLLM